MPKFLATYMGSAAGKPPTDFSQIDGKAFMQAWGEWAEPLKSQIVDDGLPVGKTKVVAGGKVVDGRNDITGYTIVEAADHVAAAALFLTHPHTSMLDLPIEVMELPPIPQM